MQENSFITKLTKGIARSQSTWSERTSMLLAGAVIICGLYWIFLLVTAPFYVKQMKESVPQVGLDKMHVLPVVESLASYQDVISQHPVFGVAKQAVSGPTRSACDEFKSKYILSGIIGGVENEALFNSKSGKQTYFAKAGETIEGVNVKTVTPHSVILNCSGQELEMAIEET